VVKKALVVGVNAYGFPNELPNCVKDADAFGQALETIYRFDEVRVVHDAEATREGVERGLEWLVQAVGPEDRLVFYFSGLGARIEKNGVIEEALVLQDGRLLGDHDVIDRLESAPPGVMTIVLDCCFGGLDEVLVHGGGQVEVARAKRWIALDQNRGRHERAITPGTKAFTPFGHVKPVQLETTAAHLRSGGRIDPLPVRLVTLAEPHARALLVVPCLGDETTPASIVQANGLSPFTYCLLNEIKRLGPARAAIEVIQATGQELRRLGLAQTPLVKEPLQPEHLALRTFLTLQPAVPAFPSWMPGRGSEDELTRSVAEAVRNTLISMKEGRTMHATMNAPTAFGEEYGTIVNTVAPIVASLLQSRQPYGGFPQGQGGLGWMGSQGWPGGFPQQGWGGGAGLQEIGPIVAAVLPALLASQHSRSYQQQPYQQQPYQQQLHQQQPYLPGLQPQPFMSQQPFAQQPFFSQQPVPQQPVLQQPFGQQAFGQQGLSMFPGGAQPYDIAQIVSTITPIVASLIQSRSYQGHFSQFLPRAA
jgi:caspase domain-containing protein